jgi:two-component system CheB/CheR fusion protein
MATLDLPEKTLPEALGQLTSHARDLFGITCEFHHEGVVPVLDGHAVMQLYKIAQESLTNAIKHAKAKRVTISLVAKPEHLLLCIENDGAPFPDLQGRSSGMGLRIMTYRASLIGGSLEVRANGGQGATVTCSVPLDGKA